jgi:hypothetical protein
VLVGRHRLGGELAAHPVGLLGEDDLAAQLAGGERSRDPAETATNDKNLGVELGRADLQGLVSLRSRLVLASPAGFGVLESRGLGAGLRGVRV